MSPLTTFEVGESKLKNFKTLKARGKDILQFLKFIVTAKTLSFLSVLVNVISCVRWEHGPSVPSMSELQAV